MCRLLIGVAFLVGTALASAAEPTRPVVIRDASIFDAAAGTMLPHRTLVLSGETINKVLTADEANGVPSDADVIDGRGKFVIPGLIDAHVVLCGDATRRTMPDRRCDEAHEP